MTLSSVLVSTVRFARRMTFGVSSLGRARWGKDFVIGPRARSARSGSFVAGSRVNIGADFVNHAKLSVGDDVMISSHVAIVGNDHPFDASDRTIQEFPSSPPARVVLEGDNLIGYGTIILGPVTIGRGTVVGAGSLVTHDLPRDVVAYGRPAVAKRPRRGRL